MKQREEFHGDENWRRAGLAFQNQVLGISVNTMEGLAHSARNKVVFQLPSKVPTLTYLR